MVQHSRFFAAAGAVALGLHLGSAQQQVGLPQAPAAASANAGRRSRFLEQSAEQPNSWLNATASGPFEVESQSADCSDYGSVLMDKDVTGQLLSMQAGLPGDCCSFCDGAASCEGWTWQQGTCFLKRQITGTTTSEGSLALLREGSCGAFTAAKENSDLDGDNLADVFSLSAGRCCLLCGLRADCQGYAFQGTTCFLKKNVRGALSRPGSVARMKLNAPTAAPPAPTPAPPTPPPAPAPPTTRQPATPAPVTTRAPSPPPPPLPSTTRAPAPPPPPATTRPPTPLPSPPSPPAPPAPATCSSYISPQTNKDLAGTAISALRSPNGLETGCCPLCSGVNGCDGYTFFKGTCYLKGQVEGFFASEGRVARVKSQPQNCNGFQPEVKDTDLAGDMLDTKFGTSSSSCCVLCQANAACEGFVFFQNACYLKSNVLGTFPSPGRVSRIKG